MKCYSNKILMLFSFIILVLITISCETSIDPDPDDIVCENNLILDDMGNCVVPELCNNSQLDIPYQTGDLISCDHTSQNFDYCYGADGIWNFDQFHGKVMWIELLASW